MARHPHRLPRDHYIGRYTYFLTASTYQRLPFFKDAELATAAGAHLLRAARKHGFADIAHVFMSDHVHTLVEGERDDSDFIKWLDLWRQLSGFYWKQRTGNFLWEEGYWDYTLRTEDSVRGIASYIAWNPVRAGMVKSPAEYRWIGSERFTVEELASVTPTKPRFRT